MERSIDDLFEGPRFLLKSVNGKAKEFDRIFIEVFNANPSRKVVEIEPKTGNQILKIVADWKMPPRARELAFESIDGLRSALDQTTCASVEALTGVPAKHSLYFPIADSERHLISKLRRDFPSELHDTILAFKPYPPDSEGVGGNPILCHLSKAYRNRHRFTVEVGARMSLKSMLGMSMFGVLRGFGHEWDMKKCELIVAVLAPGGHFTGETEFSAFPTVNKAGPLDGTNISKFFIAACKQIELIVDHLEREVRTVLANRV